MNTSVKTAEQIEFAEIFERLEKQFGTTKAEVARALRVERSYVSMLIKGQRSPHIRILEDMRQLEKNMGAGPETEGGAGKAESELNRIFHQLKEIERTDRAKFEVAKTVIESLAPANSGPVSASSRLLKKAAASVRKPDPK